MVSVVDIIDQTSLVRLVRESMAALHGLVFHASNATLSCWCRVNAWSRWVLIQPLQCCTSASRPRSSSTGCAFCSSRPSRTTTPFSSTSGRYATLLSMLSSTSIGHSPLFLVVTCTSCPSSSCSCTCTRSPRPSTTGRLVDHQPVALTRALTLTPALTCVVCLRSHVTLLTHLIQSPELNSSNPAPVVKDAEQRILRCYFRDLCRLYLSA